LPRPITVKVKRALHAQDVPLPRRMTEHSAGFDLHAAVADVVRIAPGQIVLVPCGFHMAIPRGYEAQVRPRSGLASRHGITLVNTPGTIDSDYRGEVQLPVVNLGPEPFEITRGMRLAQMVICPVPRARLVEVDQLRDTRRGHGGFGHTGH